MAECEIFDLSPGSGGFPSGWVLLDSQLIHHGHNVTAKLLVDTGHGFSDTDSIPLPVTRKGLVHELIQLPPKVMGLRWQVKNTPENFEQHPVTIRKVGFVERLGRMYFRTVPMLFRYAKKRRLRVGLTMWRLLHDLSGAYAVAAQLRLSPPDWNYRKWQYARWIRKHDTLTQQDVTAIRRHIEALTNPPLISVLMPVYNVPANLLRETLDSVLDQLYPHFELCIADDASTDPDVISVLEAYANRDPRIKVAFRKRNGHISAASNSALALASGTFVALLDHDDLLSPHALYWVAIEILQHPDAGIIYSDEDKITEDGNRLDAYHKPDWNPQLALSQNFVSHLGVYRTDMVRQIGGFREGYEGSQDYDLMLRMAERISPSQIRHIPAILYHWRIRPGSTALGHSEKDYAWEAGRKAIEDYLSRQQTNATVSRAPSPVFYRVNYVLSAPFPKVSVIIPTRNQYNLLRRCIDSLRDLSTYRNFEVIIIDNDSNESDAIDYLEILRTTPGFRVLSYPGQFNYSAMNNRAASIAEGEILCLLNNDTEIITASWMEEMLGCLLQREVGVVGAKLLYPDNTIQHAGIILSDGSRIAMHAHAFIPGNSRGYVGRACIAQDFSAVTGACMMTTREIFNSLGGLDEVNLAVAFNDVDYCLRAREAGWRVVYTPYAELYHHESASRGRKRTKESKARMLREVEYMRNKWSDVLKHDPAYNPNLNRVRLDFTLSHAPIIDHPWKS